MKRPQGPSICPPPHTHIHFLRESHGLVGDALSALFNRNSTSPSSVSHLTVILSDTCILLLGYEFTSSSPLCTQHWEVSHFIHDILLESRISQASGKMFNEHLLSERSAFPKRKKITNFPLSIALSSTKKQAQLQTDATLTNPKYTQSSFFPNASLKLFSSGFSSSCGFPFPFFF